MNDDTLPESASTTTRRGPNGRRGDSTIGNHNLPVCRSTGHRRYRDRAQARDALNSAKWKRAFDLTYYGDSNRRETRIFRCADPSCNGGFHLTSIAVWRDKA